MKHSNIAVTVMFVVVILIGVGTTVFLLNKGKAASNEPKVTVTELDSIVEYGYRLEDRDTVLYKEYFKALSEELKKEEVSSEEYAKLLSKMYIIDLYTISNKINQYDVGSLDFVSPEGRENFEKKVQDTIYKYVEDNTYGKRTQELPEVKDLGYDKKANLKLVKQDKFLYVIKQSIEKQDWHSVWLCLFVCQT